MAELQDFKEQAKKALISEGKSPSSDYFDTLVDNMAKKMSVGTSADDKSEDVSASLEPEKQKAEPQKAEQNTTEGKPNENKDDKSVIFDGLTEAALREKLSGYEAKLEEKEELASKFDYLQNHLKENSPKLDNRLIKVQKLVESGMDFNAAVSLASANVEEMSNIDAIKLAYKLEHPEYAKYDNIVEKDVLKKYGVDSLDELEDDDLARFEIDANSAKSRLMEKTSIDTELNFGLPEDLDKEIKEKTEAQKELAEKQKAAWSDFTKKTFKPNFKKLPVPDGEGGVLFDFELSSEDVDKYAVLFEQTVGSFELNEDNAKSAYSFTQLSALADKMPQIVKSIKDKAISEYQNQEDMQKSNPKIDRGEARPKSDKAAQAKQIYDAQIKDRYKI
jgi:hypothetical protein